jgi:hypothetical protein
MVKAMDDEVAMYVNSKAGFGSIRIVRVWMI